MYYVEIMISSAQGLLVVTSKRNGRAPSARPQRKSYPMRELLKRQLSDLKDSKVDGAFFERISDEIIERDIRLTQQAQQQQAASRATNKSDGAVRGASLAGIAESPDDGTESRAVDDGAALRQPALAQRAEYPGSVRPAMIGSPGRQSASVKHQLSNMLPDYAAVQLHMAKGTLADVTRVERRPSTKTTTQPPGNVHESRRRPLRQVALDVDVSMYSPRPQAAAPSKATAAPSKAIEAARLPISARRADPSTRARPSTVGPSVAATTGATSRASRARSATRMRDMSPIGSYQLARLVSGAAAASGSGGERGDANTRKGGGAEGGTRTETAVNDKIRHMRTRHLEEDTDYVEPWWHLLSAARAVTARANANARDAALAVVHRSDNAARMSALAARVAARDKQASTVLERKGELDRARRDGMELSTERWERDRSERAAACLKMKLQMHWLVMLCEVRAFHSARSSRTRSRSCPVWMRLRERDVPRSRRRDLRPSFGTCTCTRSSSCARRRSTRREFGGPGTSSFVSCVDWSSTSGMCETNTRSWS